MRLAKKRKQWPAFPLPDERGTITVAAVVATPAGPERDKAIKSWCRSVWEAWSGSREQVRELLQAELR